VEPAGVFKTEYAAGRVYQRHGGTLPFSYYLCNKMADLNTDRHAVDFMTF
jgi:hypothetical protein